MKNIVLACSMGAVLVAGPAFAQDAGAAIDPSLIIRTNGSGLDPWSASEGNDKAGGMWEGATGYSAAVQRPGAIETVPPIGSGAASTAASVGAVSRPTETLRGHAPGRSRGTGSAGRDGVSGTRRAGDRRTDQSRPCGSS